MILYKYFAESRLEVLKSATLRFTQPMYFNDPFEALPSDVYASTCNLAEMFWDEGLRDRYFEMKAAGYPVGNFDSFRSTRLPLRDQAVLQMKADPALSTLCQYSNTLQMINSIGAGILCLTERPDNSLMWSHYASECRGFVLGFDTSHAWFRDARATALLFALTRVTYSDRRPTQYKDLFFRKSKDWQYEQEWRMVCPLHACERIENSPVFVREFPHEAIASILMGSRMIEPARIELLRLAALYPRAQLLRTYPNPVTYSIESIPFESAFHIPYFFNTLF
jgi:hypothetical protein